MTTIKTIKENVNITELLSNDMYEGLTKEQLINMVSVGKLVVLINNVSKYNFYRVSTTVTNTSYDITNEEVINMLRELYKLTSNKFVKSILVTVGQSKKYTERQLSQIVGEMVKFENLIINF